MISDRDQFTEHLVTCLRDELITQLPDSRSSLTLLKEAQWIINNYIEHVIVSVDATTKKTG